MISQVFNPLSGNFDTISTVTTDPTPNGLSITSDQVLSIALSSASTTGALSSTDWNTFNNKANASTGDISQTSFSLANNQSSAADVTGLAFANGSVRSFESLVSVYINATSSLYEVFTLRGIQKGSSWDMAITSNGDNSLVDFSITNAGQVQYTSANYSGFTAGTVEFRAIVTNV